VRIRKAQPQFGGAPPCSSRYPETRVSTDNLEQQRPADAREAEALGLVAFRCRLPRLAPARPEQEKTMLDHTTIDSLRTRFRGDVIVPGDAAYEPARRVYNAMIDKSPAVIARCTDVADVRQAVSFGQQEGLLTAIRGGGHNGGGLGTCDGGLVVDLSRMRGVRVDPSAQTVRVDGGCTFGDLDHATHAFGLAVPGGIVSTTGVAGLTLGGGIGHLTRRFGLTIDSLLEADVVLADGRFVTASPKQNDDLFWAIRGGGGNFGVVTSFLFRAHEVSTVNAGPFFWPIEATAEVMAWYREFIVKAPPELSGFFATMTIPPAPMFPAELHMKQVCAVVWCHSGETAALDALLAPVRRARKPAFEHVGPMPLPVLQGLFDGLFPPGLQWYWKADFVKELSDQAIAVHAEYGRKLPTMLSTMHLYPIDGAAHRVAADATPFAYRDANWAEVIVGVDPDPANKDRIVSWAREYWEASHPFGAGGAYVNFMMDENQDRVRASYRGNYGRLAAIKARYDPTNFFRVNQNISRAVAGAA
jgi:FAD/FMN-containing dehydrogenase